MARALIATLVAVSALLAAPAASPALTLVNPEGAPVGGKLQRWVDRTPVPFAAGSVVVIADAPGGAWYDPAERTVHMPPAGMSRDGFLHELGHDFEFVALSDAGWQTWAHWMRYGVSRFQIIGASATDPGEWQAREDFADWFAGCATHGLSVGLSGNRVTTVHGRVWNRKRFGRACARIWRLDASGAPAS